MHQCCLVLQSTMASTKALLCDLCVILVTGIVLVSSEEVPPSTDDVGKGNCTCGGFPNSTIAPDAQPLISQSPGLEVKCDDEGDLNCKNLCIALATAAKAKGPEVLCTRLKTADELKLSAFYKICTRPWTYAEMSSDIPLCCEDSKYKICPSQEKVNGTEIDAKTIM